jgi:hypothetical protein
MFLSLSLTFVAKDSIEKKTATASLYFSDLFMIQAYCWLAFLLACLISFST